MRYNKAFTEEVYNELVNAGFKLDTEDDELTLEFHAGCFEVCMTVTPHQVWVETFNNNNYTMPNEEEFYETLEDDGVPLLAEGGTLAMALNEFYKEKISITKMWDEMSFIDRQLWKLSQTKVFTK